MNSICNVYGKHSPQSKTSRCSSSSVTDRNMCSYSLGQRGEINLQAGVENNTILFFQNSWLRTLCPKCSQVKHPSWFPALRGGKNSAAGLASNKQNLGVATMCRHTASTVSVTLDSLDWLRPQTLWKTTGCQDMLIMSLHVFHRASYKI